MPLFFEQQVNNHTKLAVWKIAEADDFFGVPLQRNITHPHKRLQHLAGRYLLRVLFPEFPLELIQIADTRKPYLEGEPFHFSISHCDDFAAVIVSTHNRVGVDIERVKPLILKVASKFMSAGEHEVLKKFQTGSLNQYNFEALATLVWSCKEAAFKWYGLGEVDFKAHMPLYTMHEREANSFETTIDFKKEKEQPLLLQSRFFNGVCLSYVVT